MDSKTLNGWAIKIAAAASPDEVSLAPIIMEAYMRGGKDRKNLFQQSQEDVIGGFGSDYFQAVFPWIVQAVAAAAPLINSALTSGGVEKYLSAIKDLLSIRDSLAQRKRVETLPEDPYGPLKKTISVLSKDLAKVRMSQEKRELIVYHVLQTMLEDQNSVEIVRKLAAQPK